MKANEAFLRDAWEAAAELGAVPVVIAGDFNIDPRRSAIVKSAVAAGIWYDAAVSFSMAALTEVQPTCFKNTGSPGTRIDAMMVNSVLAPALQSFTVLDKVNVPTHKAIQLHVRADAYRQMVLQYVKPRVFPVKLWKEIDGAEDEALALEPLLESESE